jgi:anti-anti-sigma factor
MNNNFDGLEKIGTKRWKKWLVITISGKFIVKSVFQMKNIFDEAERNYEQFLAMDLSKTTYLDSSAITILLNFHKRSAEKGVVLVIFGLNPDIEEVISIVGIDKVISIVKTITDLP